MNPTFEEWSIDLIKTIARGRKAEVDGSHIKIQMNQWFVRTIEYQDMKDEYNRLYPVRT